jgi:hypothetical protein
MGWWQQYGAFIGVVVGAVLAGGFSLLTKQSELKKAQWSWLRDQRVVAYGELWAVVDGFSADDLDATSHDQLVIAQSRVAMLAPERLSKVVGELTTQVVLTWAAYQTLKASENHYRPRPPNYESLSEVDKAAIDSLIADKLAADTQWKVEGHALGVNANEVKRAIREALVITD